MASINTNGAQFWRGRRVWISGHTGFKGAWLWLWLRTLGATIGRGAWLETFWLPEYDLVRLGPGARRAWK